MIRSFVGSVLLSFKGCTVRVSVEGSKHCRKSGNLSKTRLKMSFWRRLTQVQECNKMQAISMFCMSAVCGEKHASKPQPDCSPAWSFVCFRKTSAPNETHWDVYQYDHISLSAFLAWSSPDERNCTTLEFLPLCAFWRQNYTLKYQGTETHVDIWAVRQHTNAHRLHMRWAENNCTLKIQVAYRIPSDNLP